MRLLIVLVLVGLIVACGDDAPAQPTTPDAETVTRRLQAAGIPIVEITVYTAETDPNSLLGRPNGYTSKTAFRDQRLGAGAGTDAGGSVEVFKDAAGATRRREQMERLGQGSPVLVEYDYQRGPVLVRLSRFLTPDQAVWYEQALKDLSFE